MLHDAVAERPETQTRERLGFSARSTRLLDGLERMREWKYVALLIAVAWFPRLLVVLALGHGPLMIDELHYDRIAWYLSEGSGFLSYFGVPSTFRPPLYPAFLASIYWVTGPDYFAARLVQTAVAGSQAVLTYLVGRELFGLRAARIAGLIVALNTVLVLYTLLLMSENLFISLMLGAILGFLRYARSRRWTSLAVASGLLSLAVLTRPSFVGVAFITLAWLYFAAPGRRAWRPVLCTALIVAVPACVWSYRNYLIADQFIFLDSRAGYNLYIGYNVDATGRFHQPSADYLQDAYFDRGIELMMPGKFRYEAVQIYRREVMSYQDRIHPEVEGLDASRAPSDVFMHNLGRARALEFIEANPARAIGLVPKKFMYFWDLEHRMLLFGYSRGMLGAMAPPVLALVSLVVLAPFALVVIGAVLGIARARFDRGHVLVLAPVVYYTFVHSVTFAEARFHLQLVPLLALYAGSAFCAARCLGGPGYGRATWSVSRRRLAVAALVLFVGMWSYGFYETLDSWKMVFAPGGHNSYVPF